MSSRHIVFLHLLNNLDHFLNIKHLTVSNENHISYMLAHLLFHLNNIQKRLGNLSPSKISIKVFNLLDSLLYVRVIVFDAGLKHSLELASETNNVKDRILRKRF